MRNKGWVTTSYDHGQGERQMGRGMAEHTQACIGIGSSYPKIALDPFITANTVFIRNNSAIAGAGDNYTVVGPAPGVSLPWSSYHLIAEQPPTGRSIYLTHGSESAMTAGGMPTSGIVQNYEIDQISGLPSRRSHLHLLIDSLSFESRTEIESRIKTGERLLQRLAQLSDGIKLARTLGDGASNPIASETVNGARLLLAQLWSYDLSDPTLIPDMSLGPDSALLLEWEKDERELWIYVRGSEYRSHRWDEPSHFKALVSPFSNPSDLRGLLAWLKG